jgi:hypothetical protein
MSISSYLHVCESNKCIYVMRIELLNNCIVGVADSSALYVLHLRSYHTGGAYCPSQWLKLANGSYSYTLSHVLAARLGNDCLMRHPQTCTHTQMRSKSFPQQTRACRELWQQ